MSLEQAILDHTAAIRELAAAIISTCSAGGGQARLIVQNEVGKALADAKENAAVAAKTEAAKKEAAAAELEAAVSKVEDEATATREISRAEIEAAHAAARAEVAAKAKAETADKAKKAAGAAESKAPAASAGSAAEPASKGNEQAGAALDYTKDVQPVLVELVKVRSRDALVGLLAKFDAKNGAALTAEQLPLILADAQALIKGE